MIADHRGSPAHPVPVTPPPRWGNNLPPPPVGLYPLAARAIRCPEWLTAPAGRAAAPATRRQTAVASEPTRDRPKQPIRFGPPTAMSQSVRASRRTPSTLPGRPPGPVVSHIVPAERHPKAHIAGSVGWSTDQTSGSCLLCQASPSCCSGRITPCCQQGTTASRSTVHYLALLTVWMQKKRGLHRRADGNGESGKAQRTRRFLKTQK